MPDKILYRYPNPRLCLSWLPKWMLKSVPTPEIAEVEGLVSGMANGCYISPGHGDYQGISTKNGLILISSVTSHPESTLAHEFRHHWQWFNTLPYQHSTWDPLRAIFDPIGAYVMYFKQPHEFDALWFESRVAPGPDNKLGLKVVLEMWNKIS